MHDHYKLMGYCRFEDVLPLRDCRQKALLPKRPKTVIVCLFPYFAGDFPERNVARYAVVSDYHRVAGGILASTVSQLRAMFPNEEFAAFVDNSPIREVRAARLAGLGRVGSHGMLIHADFGSRVFIGEIVTSLELAPRHAVQSPCPGCGRCMEACPTGALHRDKPFRRELCRSFISQKKQALSDWEREELRRGKMVWGCDLCADACPLNKNTPKTTIAEFYEDILPVLTRDNLAGHIGQKAYGWRGESVLLRNLAILDEGAED